MPEKRRLDEALRKVLNNLIAQGQSLRQISSDMNTPLTTIQRWVTQGKVEGWIDAANVPKKESELEQKIIDATERKHVEKVSSSLSDITSKREVFLRNAAATLEKYDSTIFASVESMGMSVAEFLDMAIELAYEDVRSAYLRKLDETRNNELRQQAIEVLHGRKGDDGNGKTERGSETDSQA